MTALQFCGLGEISNAAEAFGNTQGGVSIKLKRRFFVRPLHPMVRIAAMPDRLKGRSCVRRLQFLDHYSGYRMPIIFIILFLCTTSVWRIGKREWHLEVSANAVSINT